MNYCEVLIIVIVWMGIFITRYAVSCPSRVTNSNISFNLSVKKMIF